MWGLRAVFEQASLAKIRLGEAVNLLGESQELLKEAIHYRLAVAPNLDYFDSIDKCYDKLRRTN